MIWLAWRRHRAVLLIVVALLAALGIWMALLGRSFEAVHGCLANPVQCNEVSYALFDRPDQAGIIYVLLFALPALLGIALGAPLVAGEYGRQTNRLAWTQSISRTKWLVVKFLVVAVTLVAVTAVSQLVVQWWTGHVQIAYFRGVPETVTDRIQPSLFGITGVVPVAYTLFAVALGAALGAILRRTVWAVVGTVVGYVTTIFVMTFVVRPSLAGSVFVPQGNGFPYSSVSRQPWVFETGYRLLPGVTHLIGASTFPQIENLCALSSSYAGMNRCFAAHGVQLGSFYQPADHYWSLQWSEAGIYVAAACALFGLTLWAVRRWRA